MSKDGLAEFFEKKASGIETPHPYWHFEPWDVKKRSEEVLRLADADMINLYDNDLMKHDLTDPHDFQTGFFMSEHRIRGLLGPTQGGKSKCPLMEISMMATGQFPICFRYDKGEDSGIRRVVDEFNIRRWGRRDSSTGELLDYDYTKLKDRPDGWEEWNCGTIIGVGRYPESKIAPPGAILWIATTEKSLKQNWWPRLVPGRRSEVPEEFLNKRRGVDGSSKEDQSVYFHNDVQLSVITFEAQFNKFESITTFATFIDEEPPNERIIPAVVSHADYTSIVATPYFGITYLKDLLFPKVHNPALWMSHACAYDSPYLTPEKIVLLRSICKDYEIGARIWGLPTAVKGKPYFRDNRKLNYWIRRYNIPYDLMHIEPDNCEITVRPDFNTRLVPSDQESDGRTWRIYEPVKKNVAYWVTADSAEGADVEADAGDSLSALIFRAPEKAETRPVIVAELDSWIDVTLFATVVLCGCRYYNNALLCAEGPSRGAHNALFYAELRDYPYWYRQTTIRNSTKKSRKVMGFDTTQATRKAIIDDLVNWVNSYDKDQFPEINSQRVLIQMAECVVKMQSGKPRPDHTSRGSLDLVICMGQGNHVYKYYSEQIKCNRISQDKRRKISLAQMGRNGKSRPVFIGDISRYK